MLLQIKYVVKQLSEQVVRQSKLLEQQQLFALIKLTNLPTDNIKIHRSASQAIRSISEKSMR